MRPLGSPRRADPACTPRPVRARGGRFRFRFTRGSSCYTLGFMTQPEIDTVGRTRTTQIAVNQS